MDMTPERLRKILNALNLTPAELARLIRMGDRGVRRYLEAPESEGARPIPPLLVILAELLYMRPELLPLVRDIAVGKRRE